MMLNRKRVNGNGGLFTGLHVLQLCLACGKLIVTENQRIACTDLVGILHLCLQRALHQIALGEDAGTLEEVYEPFLIKEGFIKRTPRGREVTDNAYRHLGRLRTPDQPTLFD